MSIAQCFESKDSQQQCEAEAGEGAGCGSQTITLSPGQSYGLSQGSNCGVYQLDATGCGWSDAETGCNWSAACDDEPSEPDYLTVSGTVYCQDPGGIKYRVEGARILFSKTGGTSETLLTNASGVFVSATNSTVVGQKPFTVVYDGLVDDSKTLLTGVAYSDMVGPVLDNSSICTSGKCSTCSSDYSSCNGLVEGVNEGFYWKFTGCSTTPVNPDWSISKDNAVVCYQEGTVNAYAEINYTVTVRNTVGGGIITSVVDDFDSTITDAWVTVISPATGTVSGGEVTWDDGYTFTVGETKTFTYKVRIPSTLFDRTFENHAVALLDTSEELHAYSDALVSCGEYTPPGGPLPGTGLFDSTAVRIGLGILFVVMGYGYYRFGLLDGMVNWLTKRSDTVAGKVKYSVGPEGKRDRWEQGLLRKAEKRRKNN